MIATSQLNTNLVELAQKGDSQAIGELYESNRLSIYRYFYYRIGDAQAADDLTSEVFLRMIRYLESYRVQDVSFQAWLFRIAHNLLSDYYRQQNHRDHLQLEDSFMDLSNTGDLQNVERSLNSVMLQQALNRLNDDQRDVIVMRFVAGMPIAEVAQALQKSEDAIKGLQRRGLTALRDVLSDWEVNYV